MNVKSVLLFLFLSSTAFGQIVHISPADTSFFNQEPSRNTEHQLICFPFDVNKLKDSLADGDYHIFYTNDHKNIAAQGRIKNHKKEGSWTSYYVSGQIASISNFKYGKRDGISSEYTKSGKLLFKGNFVNGQMSGAVHVYNLNYYYQSCRSSGFGNIFPGYYGVYTYTSDMLHGPANYWSHEKNFNCTFRFGKLHGDLIVKNSFGELLSISKYDNGKLISKEVYEGMSNESTYAFTLSIGMQHPETPESLQKKFDRLDSCKNLHKLHVSNYSENQSIDSLIQEYFKSLQQFKYLSSLTISGTGYSKIPPEIFNCTSLTKLHIEDLAIEELPPQVANLKRLNILILRSIRFMNKEQLIKRISKIPNLIELDLHYWLGDFPKNWHLLKQIELLIIQPSRQLESDQVPLTLNKSLFKLKNLERLELPTYLSDKYSSDVTEKLPTCQLFEIQSCFEKSTQVALADYTFKAINKMAIGDVILAFDTINQTIDTATVNAIHKHDIVNQKVLRITFQEFEIICTYNHPFRIDSNSWVEAEKLKIGDSLFILNEALDGMNKVQITEIAKIDNVTQVYNISTTKKNYFANGILVHNK